jgi:hypothetical protein
MRTLAPGRRCTHHRAARAACKSGPSTESRRPVRTATSACKRRPRPVCERPSPALVLARYLSRSGRMATSRGIQGRRERKPRRTRLQARLRSAARATTAPDYPCPTEATTILTPMLPSFVTAIGQIQQRDTPERATHAVALFDVVRGDRWLPHPHERAAPGPALAPSGRDSASARRKTKSGSPRPGSPGGDQPGAGAVRATSRSWRSRSREGDRLGGRDGLSGEEKDGARASRRQERS